MNRSRGVVVLTMDNPTPRVLQLSPFIALLLIEPRIARMSRILACGWDYLWHRCYLWLSLAAAALPEISCPRIFAPSEESVVIQPPDGIMREAVAKFNLSRFNIPTTACIDLRWRVTICILDRESEEVPIGSKLLVRDDLAAQLLGFRV